MKLGMFTACLPALSLDRIAEWAAGAGYEALEVAAWPVADPDLFHAAHLPVTDLDGRAVEETRALFDRHGLEMSALGYYENNLHPDPDLRAGIHSHLTSVIEAASALGVPYVGTFIGRDWTRTVADNLHEAEKVFRHIVDFAGERDVKIIIENCVMEGWHPDGYPCNLAYSPELWEWMSSLGLYLNWDPSHLTWIGIDPLKTIAPYADRIVHVQAKDLQVLPDAIDRFGFFGKTYSRTDPWDVGWWRYRVPGRGQVNWAAIVDALYENGFTGTVSVEHEDPVWSGTEAKVKQGLEIAHSTLRPLIIG